MSQGGLVDCVTMGCRTYDRKVVGSIPGRDTIKWLLLGWVTVCRQVNHLGIYSQHQGQLSLPSSGVGKSSTGLSAWLELQKI